MNTARILTSTLAAAALLSTSLLARDRAPFAQELELREVMTTDHYTGETHRYLEIGGQASQSEGFLFLVVGRQLLYLPAIVGPQIQVAPELVLPLSSNMGDEVVVELPARLEGHVYVQAVLLHAGSLQLATSGVLDIGSAAQERGWDPGSDDGSDSADTDDGSPHDGDGTSSDDGTPGNGDGTSSDDGSPDNGDGTSSDDGSAGNGDGTSSDDGVGASGQA